MKPIIFSAEMVRAILDGRKTQTRRLSGIEDVNKTPDIWEFKKVCDLDYMTKPQYKGRFGAYFHTEQLEPNTLNICPAVCKYGAPGDLLWVRETWGAVSKTEELMPLTDCTIEYRADLPAGCTDYPGGWPADEAKEDEDAPRWRPSIFMPRWASRITLRITDIRVERLQDISDADCDAEMFGGDFPDKVMPGHGFHGGLSLQDCFGIYWDSINAKRGYPWSVNPWVWVIEFERKAADE